MNSELLDYIFKFHTKENTIIKTIKFKRKKYILTVILILSLALYISSYSTFLLSRLGTDAKFVFIPGIFTIITGILSFLYVVVRFNKSIINRQNDFLKFIKEKALLEEENLKKKNLFKDNYSIKLRNFDDFLKYNLIVNIYNKSEFHLDNYKFRDLYDLIDIVISKYNFYDYITPKSVIVYSFISSFIVSIIVPLLTALFSSFFEILPENIKGNKVVLLSSILYVIIIIFLISVYTYYCYRSIKSPKTISNRKRYIYLKEALKKCEIDFVDTKLVNDDIYMDMINNIIKHSHKYTYKKK